MRRKIFKTSVWGAAVLVVVVLLGTGGVLWRLAASPLQVSFLLPYLQSSLVDPASGYALDIDNAAITWDRRDQSLHVHAGQAALRRVDGPLVLTIPTTNIRLDLWALLRGEIWPSSIVVEGIAMGLNVDENGRFSINTGEPQAKRPATAADMWAALDDILMPKDPASPFHHLRSLVVRDGRVVILDRRQPAPWSANILAMQINKEDGALDATAAVTVRPAGQAESFDMHARLFVSAETASGEVTFREFNAAKMLAAFPNARLLHGLDAPLTGTLALDAERGRGAQRLRFDFAGGAGGQFSGPFLPKPLPLQDVDLQGAVDLVSGAVDIETAQIDTPLSGKQPTRLTYSGRVTPRDAGVDVDGNLTVESLSVADLKAYWPAGDRSPVRTWLDGNVERGHIEQGTIAAHLAGRNGELTADGIRSISGSVSFSDVAVRVSPDVPPLDVPEGSVEIKDETIRVAIPGATLGPMSFAATTADISGLPAGSLRVAVGTRFAASITETLVVAEKLDGLQPSQLPFPAGDLSGRLTGDVRIAFPLNAPLSMQTAKVSVKGTIGKVNVRKAILEKDITGADLSYTFDGSSLNLSGRATIAGAAAEITLRQAVPESGVGETTFEARLPELTPQFWSEFGIALEPTLQGPHAAVMTGTIRPGNVITLDTTIDLRRAQIALPMPRWTKPPGTPGTLRAAVTVGTDDTATVETFTVAAGDLSATGSARIAFNGAADITATVADFKLQRTHLRDIAVRSRGDSLALRVGDGVLDLSDPAEGAADAKPASPATALDDLPFSAFDIEVPGLRRVYFAADRFMENVAVRLIREGDRWDFAQITAAVPDAAGPNRAALLNYGRQDNGDMSLRIHAADLGATLKALDMAEGVRRGQFDLAGTRRRDDPDGPVAGRFIVSDVTLRNTPVLAQILAVESLVDFRRLFEGDGIMFKEITGDAAITERNVAVRGLRAVGGSLAITANGSYDLARDTVAFKGHVVPARRLNALIAKIPVLGSVLTGTDKEGLVAVGFTVDGPAREPRVSVNPGSVLTPGILRDVFGIILN